MKKNRTILLVALLVVVAFLAGSTGVRRQRWEYQETCGTVSSLNELGQSGWELVSATSQANDIKCFYLKRAR